ncbi:MAG: serine/threonine transporter SstT [Clostridia bacterium]|nr:serine/threonine transporter SstT [Clostridia bacterium]
MGKLIEKWNSISLVLRILGGIIVGTIIAVVARLLNIVDYLAWLKVFGDVFVGALKAIAPILVFVLVINAFCNSGKKLDKRFGTVIFLYILTTFIAAFVAVLAGFLFPIDLSGLLSSGASGNPPQNIGEVILNLFTNMVKNPVGAIVEGNYLGVLFWAIIIGIALKKSSDNTKGVVADLSNAISSCVRFVISLAPFGILGIIFDTVARQGLGIFTTYGKLILVLVGCMLFISLVINPIIASITIKKNAYPLVLRCLKESGITAFFTRSSAANIPVNMKLCESLGLDKDFYSVSIPLGATINMDGAAITITVLAMAAAVTCGITIDIPTALLLSVIATLGACGASGVPSGSLMLVPLACGLFGVDSTIAMQVVAVGLAVSVVQDSLETALNSSGDVLFAAIAEFREWRKQGKEIKF